MTERQPVLDLQEFEPAALFEREPRKLREELQARGALEFPTFNSGLFPAASLSGELGELTGMGNGLAA
jgi:hypothetical protein